MSLLFPCYNGAEYPDELVQGVLQQNYPNIEHLIIDDGSKDDGATVAILEKYSHLHWWSRSNKGQYATMNEGLLAAQGEIVCFVSADDIVLPLPPAKAVSFLEAHPRSEGVFGITLYVDPHGNPCPYFVPFQNAPISLVAYFAHIPHCSLYINKSALLAHQLFFDDSLRYAGDYDWMIQIGQCGLRIDVIDEELSKVRLHPNQTSQRNLGDSLIEVRRIIAGRKVNEVYYCILQGIYSLRLRLWKLNLAFRKDGLSGVLELAFKWKNMKLGPKR